ncbi:MAG: DUF1573 domain-containing protein [Bacteroidetes bacterium]|jgi:hypothetical protein|nr:DUF1573 domain-containing protein [Bacteroidota bacterium]MDA0973549.1 DUF1573 domain-containing protein [Bacteroidota bacterium]
MKKAILFLAAIGLLSSASIAQTGAAVQSGPSISIDKEVHDYGDIEKGADPYCEFLITNKGNEPLILTNAKGSCGCTVPEWSKEPVLPGESTVMKVKYDTKRVGPINKSVTITSNATNEPTKVIRIKGMVLNPDSESGTPVKETPTGAPVIK